MTRRATPLTILLLWLITMTACSPAKETHPQPTPTLRNVIPTSARIVTASQPPTPLPKPRLQSGATTVLLLGTDRRSLDGDRSNTDTIMLLHLDPNTQRVAILSVPRDLYVDIPGHEQGRINTAYAWGEQDGRGGLLLAAQTVSATLGIPVQHAVLLDFQAFVTLVDAIGGVDVAVPHAISDPTYPDSGIGYDPFYLAAGQHHLDGATALKYARTRATPGGDFDRTARQRQLMVAARDQIMRLELLPDLITQSPQLWADLQNTLETDLTLGEIVDLTVTAARIPPDRITMSSLDQGSTISWTTPSGAQVLIPDQAAIESLLADLFAPPHTAASTQ
jgi:LCP family protein required for cell wall assembly